MVLIKEIKFLIAYTISSFSNSGSHASFNFWHLFLEGVMEKQSFFSNTYSSDVAVHIGSKTKSD